MPVPRLDQVVNLQYRTCLTSRMAMAVLLSLASGCGIPSFLVTPVQTTNGLTEEVVQEGKGLIPPKIAIIGVEGMLVDVRTGGLLQPGEHPLSLFVEELKAAENDDAVKAVVLRVNSPGGTVTTSDTMYELVQRFKSKTHKPVVVAAQEMCASGAYYLSCAADKIVVHPTCLVGSIGVIFQNFDVADTMAMLGIRAQAIHSGTLKDMGSPFRHATVQERQIMQDMVNEYFARFEKIVSAHRPIAETAPSPTTTMPSTYAGVYSGRVFTGEKAVELGMADKTGLLEDAIDLARELAKTPDAKAVLYHRPYGSGGSVYAGDSIQPSKANVIQLNLPESRAFLPCGFYYLWDPP